MSRVVCKHCWGENDASVENCRHCGELLPVTRSAGPLEAPDVSQPAAGNRSKWALVGVVFALALGSVLYRLLVWGRLEQTAALFIGLPALLAAAVALTPQAKSSTGMIMKVMTLALFMSGILLGEGFICILMAAPLFYLVGFIVGKSIDYAGRDAEKPKRHRLGAVAMPLLLLFSLEGVHRDLSFPRSETVTVERTIVANAASVERILGQALRFDQPLPYYLRLGFPKPTETTGQGLHVGDRRLIHFAGGEGKPGDLLLEVAAAQPDRVLFRIISDTSHISHWLDWKEAEVTWTARDAAHTDVRWSLRYDRRLDPAWYFAPWERYGVSCAADYLITTLATPRTEVALMRNRDEASDESAR